MWSPGDVYKRAIMLTPRENIKWIHGVVKKVVRFNFTNNVLACKWWTKSVKFCWLPGLMLSGSSGNKLKRTAVSYLPT